MVNVIHKPDLNELLPPLLSHLPLGFASAQAPPSLLPLLSPILRSRVQLLQGTEDSWLALLTWSRAASNSDAEALLNHLKEQEFTPHYNSGEVEIGDYDLLGIKRVDPEMLEARAVLKDRELLVRYVWVTEDSEGDSDTWKVLEVEVLNGEGFDEGDEDNWHQTVAEAEKAYVDSISETKTVIQKLGTLSVQDKKPQEEKDDDDDEDAYWARYDCGNSESPAPEEMEAGPSEDEYFSRYGQVDSQIGGSYETTSQINSFTPSGYEAEPATKTFEPIPQYPISFHSRFPGLNPVELSYSSDSQTPSDTSTPPTTLSVPAGDADMKTPVPETRKRSGSNQSRSSSVSSETGIRQHISTTMKSLYRLAKSGGIEREEFQRLVRVEMELLTLMDLENE